jgi:type IV secretion system protein TrbH
MRTQILLLALAVSASGCQTSGGVADNGLTPAELPSAAASAIAGDLSARLAEQAAPKDMAFRLTPDLTGFGAALEAALRGWGYSVNPEKPTDKTTRLDYAIERSDGDVLASVAMPSVILSRTYTASGTGASPKSPLSILRRD